MEAIAAAGALPGLASATIQLGTATFQFYQQLHGLYKAIKHGERDLATAIRKLEQHGDFIKELRFNFEHIADSSIPATTRDLFERCIVDSEVEVREFRSLLHSVGKHHFKKKSWHAVETGSRLRFHEDNIQKYYDLLDKQMHRFLFLQSSVQSMRMESSLSDVMATLVKQGAKAIDFYERHPSAQKPGSRLRSSLGTDSNEKHPLMKRMKKNTITSSLEDIGTAVGLYETTKTFSTLCGTISVTTFSNSGVGKGRDCQLAYKIWFQPYSWISRTLVEWRCRVDSMKKAPTTVLSVTTSIVCNDTDTLDALGLVPLKTAYYGINHHPFCWTMTMPKHRKVRALLDAGQLLRDHVLCLFGLAPVDIITAFLGAYGFVHNDRNREHKFVCTGASLDYLHQQYLEYCRVTELLLSYGFQPHHSSWQWIYDIAARNSHHISTKHPELTQILGLSSKSTPFLILERVGYIIPLDYKLAINEQLWIEDTSLTSTGSLRRTSHIYNDDCNDTKVSYLAHLVTLQGSTGNINQTLELDPLDLTDDHQGMFDRWLLGLFAPFRPEIACVIKEHFKSQQTNTTQDPFHIDYIREEFRQPPTSTNKIQREYFLKFICSYGNAAIVRQLDIAALTPREIQGMLLHAAQSPSDELFDLLMGYNSRTTLNRLHHTRFVRDRIVSDSSFLDRYHQMLEDCKNPPLTMFLNDHGILSTLLLSKPQPLPEHIQRLVLGGVRRFESKPTVTGEEISSLIYKAMIQYWQSKAPSTHLLQDIHFYDILRLLVRTSASQPYLDKPISTHLPPLAAWTCPTFPGNKSESYKALPHPSVEGYSALMLALHCGMKPAVQILVDYGVSITKPMYCGKSALSPLALARENSQSQHPRRWVVCYEKPSGAKCPMNHHIMPLEMDISEDTDKDMLEILLQALGDRGEVEADSDTLPMSNRWMLLREKVSQFTGWLFSPSYTFDPDAFRENSIYVILVSTLWFLSILKVLKAELGNFPSSAVRLLSRPIVILALIAWVLSHFW